MSLASLPEVRALREVPVATAAQMAEVDRITSEELGVSLEALMERACRQIDGIGGACHLRFKFLAGELS